MKYTERKKTKLIIISIGEREIKIPEIIPRISNIIIIIEKKKKYSNIYFIESI